MTLMLASCSEDYKDWAEPQSNPQGTVITFGNGAVAGVDLIDYALLPEDVETVKVCNLTVPNASDTNYHAETFIVLNGEEYPITNDGYMDAAVLNKYVVDHYGRAQVQRDIPAVVKWVMTNGSTATTITSEPFEVHVILMPLTIPDLWYLAGAPFGDGNGLKDVANQEIGVSLVPMYGTPGSVTILTYVGYIQGKKSFKIFHNPGESDQFCMVDGVITRNNGEAGGNIQVKESGYYRITLDTDKDEVTIEQLDINPSVYSQISMPGAYQGWEPTNNLMTGINTKYENHDWIVKNFTVTEGTLLKFAADGSWDVNWGGGAAFPLGMGTQDGDNIVVTPGTYTVMFNDILGYYYFMEQ